MLNSPIGASWTRVSPIEVLITRACEPTLPEPNYALHLEVAEYINNKKANNPREAAMLIARLANHRNPHVAVLSLALLETLVQSCGYPFHLQISTKEFLNELVRRFPERPPPFPGPVMSRILDLIHTWKETICTESRWKDDLGNIRDMHRLLSFKGYRFRDLPRPQQQVTAVSNLKTAEELENEDREAQSAKLQELIRRGTPRDLAAAQELMKALAGANPDAKPDYRAQALTELNKLESKVILLNELLDNFDNQRGERFASGDAYDQVASILSGARPKIQKWISDAETEDPESLDTFLQINDQINTVLTRYDAFKRGDYVAASNPIPAELATGAKTANDLSLIDFDDGSAATGSSSGQTGGVDDLVGLFGSGPSVTTQPQAPLPQFTTPQYTPSYNIAAPQARLHNGVTTASPPAIMLPSTPKPSSRLSSPTGPPNYFANGGSSAMGMGMMNNGTSGGQTMGGMGMGTSMGPSMTPMAPQYQSPQSTSQGPTNPPPATQGKDPFADLAGLF